MTEIVAARNLTFGISGATLVDNVSLTLAEGETVALVGPNGAGKSTLLRLLSGDLRPERGTIRLKGRELRGIPARELALQRMMLSQHVNVTFPFTVAEVVAMGVPEGSVSTNREQVIARALDDVGLGSFRQRQLPTLSGGEQQRAHFARILVQLACGEADQGPGLLLLDEPTSSLDLRHQIDLLARARTCARNGTAVIAVLHDLNLAVRFADRIIVMHHGRVAEDGAMRSTLDPEIMRRIFDVETSIHTLPDGTPFLLPQTMRPAGGPDSSPQR